MKTSLTLAIVILVSIFSQIIVILPWWSFLIPIFILGLILPLQKWKVNAFLSGFVAGFLVWILSTLYFEAAYNGEITHVIGKMILIPDYLVYGSIGLIGGTLTGLAFYSGFLLRRGREELQLELPED